MVLIVEDSLGVGGAEGCHLFLAACKGSQRKVFYPAPPTRDTSFNVEVLLKFAFMFFFNLLFLSVSSSSGQFRSLSGVTAVYSYFRVR